MSRTRLDSRCALFRLGKPSPAVRTPTRLLRIATPASAPAGPALVAQRAVPARAVAGSTAPLHSFSFRLDAARQRPSVPLFGPGGPGDARHFSSTSFPPEATMASSKLEALVSRARLVEVRDFWFEHLTGPDDLILFKQEHGKRWFFGGQELDRACVERFGPALEAIRDSGVRSGADMLAVARPQDPSEWLGLVLLLDQMPRNCYRGDAAAVAFTIFDPIARGVALAAMQRGVPDEEPATRWRFAYRQWFYLPLMHSEDVATHEVAEQAYERMRRDVSALIDGGDAAPDGSAVGGEDRARAAAVVRANADDARKLVDMQILFEKKHFDIIKRFGRYPHRNKVLGRTSTPEEVEYLENGGETFSQPPADAGDKK